MLHNMLITTIFYESHPFTCRGGFTTWLEYDFFAVSMPEIEVFEDDIQLRSTQYCNYLRALGHIGLGERQEADSILDAILSRQVDHQGALDKMHEHFVQSS